MPHDDLLSETKRDRRIRDRRRIIAMLERRNSWFRSVFPDVLTYVRPGLSVGGRAADWWHARKFYSARKQCRGECCVNDRRFHKAMSFGERRAEVDAKEQSEELELQHKPSRFTTWW
jgi:hypothetical protein